MAYKVITINSVQDFFTAAREIRHYSQRLQRKTDRIVRELVSIGVETCTNETRVIHPEYNGESTDIVVTASPFVDHSQSVVESGHQVYFSEFGAGSLTDTGHPYAQLVPIDVYDGSYSAANNGMYASTMFQYWFHKGNMYKNYAPNRSMFKTAQTMRSRIRDVVRSVFA